MRAGREEVLHEVARLVLALRLAHGHAFEALAAAVLRAVFAGERALDVAAVAERDDGRLVRDEVGDGNLALLRGEVRAPRRGVLRLHGEDLFLDDGQHTLLAGEDVHEVANGREDRVVVVLRLLPVERGELVETQLEDVVDLFVREDVFVTDDAGLIANEDADGLRGGGGEFVSLDPLARFVAVGGVSDDLDEVVQPVEREEVGLELLGVALGHGLEVARAADDDFPPVLDVNEERVLDVEQPRAAVVDGEHVHREGRLERGVLVEVVDDDLRPRVALQVDDDARVLVRLVADAADFRQNFLVGQFGDARDEVRTVHGEGNLGDDELLATGLGFLHAHLAAHLHGAASGVEVVPRALHAVNGAPGGEVRPFDQAHQRFDGDGGVVDECAHAIDHFAEVVRRNVGGHADGDARAAIDEQVREGARQHCRLGALAVVVRDEVDGVLVHVVHEDRAERGELRLGVTHGGRGIAFHRAEVALTTDENVPHGPRLRHVHERGVDRLVTVRVVVTHRLADDLGALHFLPVRPHTKFAHGKQNAPLRGLQAVPRVRQRPGNDDGHRIVEERRLHFLLHRDGLDAGIGLRCGGRWWCVGIAHGSGKWPSLQRNNSFSRMKRATGAAQPPDAVEYGTEARLPRRMCPVTSPGVDRLHRPSSTGAVKIVSPTSEWQARDWQARADTSGVAAFKRNQIEWEGAAANSSNVDS